MINTQAKNYDRVFYDTVQGSFILFSIADISVLMYIVVMWLHYRGDLIFHLLDRLNSNKVQAAEDATKLDKEDVTRVSGVSCRVCRMRAQEGASAGEY